MKTKLMAMLLMASGAMFAGTHLSIGVQIGSPVPYGPAPVVATPYRPPCPGPGYVWVDGYYDAAGAWFDGYWAMPPYAGAYWVAPRIVSGHYNAGYWGGSRGVYRNDYHVAPAPRVVERHDFGRSAPVHREPSRGFDRDHGRGGERGGGFGKGFRR
ncbi:MAG TPA: hypothetical protein VG672_06595 [Bryobacteraceae bacterium]|nr:hypothetical protein [Bryobacteraceae bacterium]